MWSLLAFGGYFSAIVSTTLATGGLNSSNSSNVTSFSTSVAFNFSSTIDNLNNSNTAFNVSATVDDDQTYTANLSSTVGGEYQNDTSNGTMNFSTTDGSYQNKDSLPSAVSCIRES